MNQPRVPISARTAIVLLFVCLTTDRAWAAPSHAGMVKIAAVQTSPLLADNAHNLADMLAKTEVAAANGAQLIVFPELSVTAYKYLNTAEGLLYAEPVPGPSTDAMAAKAAELGVYVVFGLLETDGENLFDGVVLVGPEGYIGKYEKWTMGFRSESLTFTRGWETPPVFETAIGRIGIASCYDGAFPEVTRLLGLQSAQIMVLIDTENGTTWRDYVRSRAAENGAYAVVANRVGGERLSTFNGFSLIAAPTYQLLASASTTSEEIIYATVDLGALGPSLIAQRRPELYGALSEMLPAQILSVDLEPQSNVTGHATTVAVTTVTASIPPGTRVVATLVGPDGKAHARATKELGVERNRIALQVPAEAPAGAYSVEVTVGRKSPYVASQPYTIKDFAKPGMLGVLPVGPGAARSGTIYVSFDSEVEMSTGVALQLAGGGSSTTLSGAINNAGIDNRLSVPYSGLAYGESYAVVLPAGSVRSVADGTFNEEVRFSFTVQPVPVLVDAALVQLSPQDLDVAANLATVLAKISDAAAAGGDLIVFPELTLTGSRFASRAEAASVAEPVPGPSVDALVAQARASSAYAVVGLVESDGAALYDTLVLVGPEGLVGKHRKTHLAPHEITIFDAGDVPSPVLTSALGPVGLSFGYENAFPEVIRSLAIRGALLVVGAYADDGTLWQELARTRASENKVYVIAANRTGTEDGTTYGGRSLTARTSRAINVQAGSGAETVKASLDMYEITKRTFAYVDRATAKVRSTDYYLDRRPGLYRPLTGPPTCFGEIATIVGTDEADVLTGTPGHDVIAGLGGDDLIRGLGGDDLICAGEGHDTVQGGQGDDSIDGGGGNDRLSGMAGEDLLLGGNGDDQLAGGPGADVVDGGGGSNRIQGGPGADACSNGARLRSCAP